MNLRQMEVFRAVMIAGGISGAARLLHISQPAVSRLLRHTETKLGLPLFERVKGRLHPTPEARTLHRSVEDVYHGVGAVNELASQLADGGAGTLRIVCSPSLSMALVPQAIAQLRARLPDLRVSLEALPHNEVIERLVSHRADVGVTMFPVEHRSIAASLLASAHFACAFRRGHPLEKLRTIKPEDLLPYPLISFRTDTPQGFILDEAFRKRGMERRIDIEVRVGQTACALVQAGAGVAVVAEFSVSRSAFPDIDSRPFIPRTQFRAHFVRDRDGPLSRAGELFRQCMIDAFKLAGSQMDAGGQAGNALVATISPIGTRRGNASRKKNQVA